MLRRAILAVCAGAIWTSCFAETGVSTAMAQDPHAFVNTLMPEPEHLTVESGYLPLTTSFTAATSSFHNARLDNAIHRMLVEFENNTGLQIDLQPSEANTATLLITVGGP